LEGLGLGFVDGEVSGLGTELGRVAVSGLAAVGSRELVGLESEKSGEWAALEGVEVG